MSKQFETKKESISLINKAYRETSEEINQDIKFKSLEKKYDTLVQRVKNLEKVYLFHKGIVQNISGGIITIDFNAKITFINTAALRVVEYKFNELINVPIRNLFADPDEADQIIDNLINKRQMYESKEINLITQSNQIIPIGFSTTLLEAPDSQYQGVIISFRDLTNLINFRIQMERMDRLATLGELSAGIAHEIRNPLAGIKTSAQVLEESFGPGDFRSQLVARLVKEIDRSNELLKKFFNFAKPGRPKKDFVNIEMVIDGVYLLLAPKMKKRNILFTKNYTHNLPDVYVDESQIEQVLLNLYLNSIDAMEKGGTLIVNTSKKIIKNGKGESSVKEMVVVSVEDNGVGIDKKNLEKIFNPFFTTKSNGVGLGLSISSRLIEENGGKLEVKSELGHGTVFNIFLPIK
jgi:two-component system sensor histidine kinase AtoS